MFFSNNSSFNLSENTFLCSRLSFFEATTLPPFLFVLKAFFYWHTFKIWYNESTENIFYRAGKRKPAIWKQMVYKITIVRTLSIPFYFHACKYFSVLLKCFCKILFTGGMNYSIWNFKGRSSEAKTITWLYIRWYRTFDWLCSVYYCCIYVWRKRKRKCGECLGFSIKNRTIEKAEILGLEVWNNGC